MKTNDVIRIKLGKDKVGRETEKAWQIDTGWAPSPWIPKSQATWEDEWLVIPVWLARKTYGPSCVRYMVKNGYAELL